MKYLNEICRLGQVPIPSGTTSSWSLLYPFRATWAESICHREFVGLPLPGDGHERPASPTASCAQPPSAAKPTPSLYFETVVLEYYEQAQGTKRDLGQSGFP